MDFFISYQIKRISRVKQIVYDLLYNYIRTEYTNLKRIVKRH